MATGKTARSMAESRGSAEVVRVHKLHEPTKTVIAKRIVKLVRREVARSG